MSNLRSLGSLGSLGCCGQRRLGTLARLLTGSELPNIYAIGATWVARFARVTLLELAMRGRAV